MSISRHEARHQALNVLFAADVRGVSASTLLEKTGSISPVSGPVSTDAKIMVALYEDNRKQIDRMIAAHSDGWMLKRMAGVDRNAMRLAIAEMAFGDVPCEIAINEAVNLVGELGGPNSPRFVNGVLGAIQRELQAQAAEAEAAPLDTEAAPADGADGAAEQVLATSHDAAGDAHTPQADEEGDTDSVAQLVESSTDQELQADSSELNVQEEPKR